MKGSIKLFLVIFVISLNLIPFGSAMATGNIIDNSRITSCSLENPRYIVTYANIDGDYSTGAWINGTWYPNEIQIALYPFNGTLSVNCAIDGGIFFDGPCDLAILFIDATAPGWVYNRPETWLPRRIKRAEIEMNRSPVSFDSIPCIKAVAYDNWKHPVSPPCYPIPGIPWLCSPFTVLPKIVAKAIMTNISPKDLDAHTYTLMNYQNFSYGLSEIHIHTDYLESSIMSLCLFDTIRIYFSL